MTARRPTPPRRRDAEGPPAGLRAVPDPELPTVGPVLTPGPLTEAIVAAIRRANPQVTIRDRGGYLRVLSPQRCVLRRVEVEAVLGHAFRLPLDLERVMPSFKGKLRISDDAAEWGAGE